MPRVCSICASASRSKIESAILSATAELAISRKFKVSRFAVTNHKTKCMAAVVAEKRKALADRLFDEIEEIHGVTRDILKAAQLGQPPSPKLALSAVREARENIALVHKLIGPRVNEEGMQITWEELCSIHSRQTKAPA